MNRDRKELEPISVVDRRRFTPEGERRPDAEAESPAAVPEPTPVAPAAQAPTAESEKARTARQAYEGQKKRGPHPPADFETLVLSLATSAMYQLGLVQDDPEAPFPTDPEAARQTIDILGVLQEKTRGNVTPREQQLLEDTLYQLRMAYVQVTREPTAGARRTPTGA